jgi:hypothetical protein
MIDTTGLRMFCVGANEVVSYLSCFPFKYLVLCYC